MRNTNSLGAFASTSQQPQSLDSLLSRVYSIDLRNIQVDTHAHRGSTLTLEVQFYLWTDLGLREIVGAVVEAVELSEGLRQGPGVAHHAGRWVVAVSQVLQHLLARQTPGELAVPSVHIRAAAVPDVQHQILRALQ